MGVTAGAAQREDPIGPGVQQLGNLAGEDLQALRTREGGEGGGHVCEGSKRGIFGPVDERSGSGASWP